MVRPAEGGQGPPVGGEGQRCAAAVQGRQFHRPRRYGDVPAQDTAELRCHLGDRERLPVRAEGQGRKRHALSVEHRRRLRIARLGDVPQTQGAVVTGGCEGVTVRGVGDRAHCIRKLHPREGIRMVGVGQVPQPHAVVQSGAGDRTPVRAHGHTRDLFRVAFEEWQGPRTAGIGELPDPDVLVPARAGQHVTVLGEGQAPDRPRRTGELGEPPRPGGVGRVPELCGPVAGPDRQQVPVLRECDGRGPAVHVQVCAAGVVGQAPQAGRLSGCDGEQSTSGAQCGGIGRGDGSGHGQSGRKGVEGVPGRGEAVGGDAQLLGQIRMGGIQPGGLRDEPAREAGALLGAVAPMLLDRDDGCERGDHQRQAEGQVADGAPPSVARS